MFRFKAILAGGKGIFTRNKKTRKNKVSIHPMFRFKSDEWGGTLINYIKFQYILCFGAS